MWWTKRFGNSSSDHAKLPLPTPCNRKFGVIEGMQKRRDHLETFSEWNDMIRERLEITAKKGQRMKDFKVTLVNFTKPMRETGIYRSTKSLNIMVKTS